MVSEILSQNQIDKLMSDLLVSNDANILTADQKKVINYDFNAPRSLSKVHLKIISNIFENFAREFSNYLSVVLRIPCQIKVNTIEEQFFYEYSNALSELVLIGVYNLMPDDGTIMMGITNNITFSIIEILMGGNCSGSVLEREFTDIEITLMKRVLKQAQKNINSSFSNFIDINTQLDNIETNSQLSQMVPMNENVLIIVMDINIDTLVGTLSVCIPIDSVKAILEKIIQNSNSKKIDIAKETQDKKTLLSHINDAEVDIVGVFGNSVLTYEEIINLQVGDIIKLNQFVGQDVKVCINSKTRFYGNLGLLNNKKAIRIKKII